MCPGSRCSVPASGDVKAASRQGEDHTYVHDFCAQQKHTGHCRAPSLPQASMPEKLPRGKHGATSEDELPDEGRGHLESRLVWGLASRNSKCSMPPHCTEEWTWECPGQGGSCKAGQGSVHRNHLAARPGRQAGSALDVLACWNEGTEHSLNYR